MELERRYQKYHGVWPECAHATGYGESVNIRKVIVQQDDIKPGILDLSYGFVARKNRADIKTPSGQRLGKGPVEQLLILYDEDADTQFRHIDTDLCFRTCNSLAKTAGF